MHSLEHFVNGDNKCNGDFLNLIVNSQYLDKDDFLDTNYFVNKNAYRERGGKGASTLRRGKKSMPTEAEGTKDESWRDIAMNLSSNVEEEDCWEDLALATLELTLEIGGLLTRILEISDM